MTSLSRLDSALLAARQWPRRPHHRRRFSEQLPSPIELTTVRVLRAVERALGEAPMINEIAAHLGVEPSTASRFVDRAEGRGDVERCPCPRDGRRTRVALTPAGRATLADVAAARQAVLVEVTKGWDEEDLLSLADLLERLGQRFDEFEAFT